MLKKPGIILLALGISTLLSSCLVSQKDVETIARTTDELRIYESGDRIDYDITVVISSDDPPTFRQGVMRVLWEQTADLTNPVGGPNIGPVLKETTTITYDDNTEPESIVIRYISQDEKGKMVLHAIDDGTNTYWPYSDGTVFPVDGLGTTPVIFDSPMVIGITPANSGEAYVIAECSNNLCNSQLYKFRDESVSVVGDTIAITTSMGKFSNPFQIKFEGGIAPSGALAIELLGDIRDACGTSSETISHGTAAGVGNLFVLPEIGIIRMENACRVTIGNGTIVLYTATIRSTNIALP